MFREYLKDHDLRLVDFSGKLFEPASNRDFWDKRYNKAYVENAEKCLGFDWPNILATHFMAFKQNGERAVMENPHFERRRALITFVLGEIVEYKGRFLPDIVNGIQVICEETFWGLSAHEPFSWSHRDEDISYVRQGDTDYIDLFAAETGCLISVIHYMLNDALKRYCPDILPRMEYELERRIKTPYLLHHEWFWMGYNHDVNNWNPWILSNVITVFLLNESNSNKRYNAIIKMITELQRYYDRIPDDGGCDEGPGYWSVSGATVFEFCNQLRLATNGVVNFLNDEKIKNMITYQMHIYIGKLCFVNFSDGVSKIMSSPVGVIYEAGKYYGFNDLISYAGELCKCTLTEERGSDTTVLREAKIKREIMKLQNYGEIMSLKEFEPQKVYFHRDTQTASLREGKWFLGAKGGNNDEGHNHNDVGSFILCFDSKQILIDAGCGTYTKKTFSPERYTIWTMQSAYHNLPLVNGIMQHEGGSYRASEFKLCENGTVTEFASAYPSEAKLTSLTRRLVLDDGLTVSDELELLSESNEVIEYFMTSGDVEKTKNGVIIDKSFLLTSNAGEVIADYVDLEGDEKLIMPWGKGFLTRIGFKIKCKKTLSVKIELRRI